MRREAADLLKSLHAMYPTTRSAAQALASDKPVSRQGFDFTTLPAYDQVRLARAAGETFGVASPFFRPVEAVEGTRVRIGGTWVENFASYDYLSLNLSDEVCRAVANGTETWGVSATASRLVGGERAFHGALEVALAGFAGAEAALATVSGHATNVGLLRTLVGPGDLVAVDALAHNSVYEGIRASGAAHVSIPHGDLDWLDAHLSEARDRYRHCLIVVEGLFSMDGDMPDLPRLVEIKARHGAWLMVDEAHSFGVLGVTGRGLCEEQGVPPGEVEIRMGTLSKAFCSCGGFVLGSAGLIDLLRYNAPGFVYSVGLSAPDAHAARATIAVLEAEPGRVMRLRALGARFRTRAQDAGLDTGRGQGLAVAPVMVGDSLKATWVSNALLERGFNVLPIIAPAVPDRSARLRLFLNAGHADDAVDAVVDAIAELVTKVADMALDDIVAAARG